MKGVLRTLTKTGFGNHGHNLGGGERENRLCKSILKVHGIVRGNFGFMPIIFLMGYLLRSYSKINIIV